MSQVTKDLGFHFYKIVGHLCCTALKKSGETIKEIT